MIEHHPEPHPSAQGGGKTVSVTELLHGAVW